MAVYELRKMFENGKLQDIKALIGPKRTSIFTDQKGHAGDIAIDTGTLIWLKAIYDINPMDIPKIEKYESDIREIATRALRLTGKYLNKAMENFKNKKVSIKTALIILFITCQLTTIVLSYL